MKNIIYTLFLCLLWFCIYFHRKPYRTSNLPSHIPVSPADGVVVSADGRNISIFLNIFNVHYQYVPMDSYIKDIKTIHGKNYLASKPESEHNAGVRVTFGSPIGDIIVTQRVGFFVRRISTHVKVGQKVYRSQPYGLIRFGSRVDIVLPFDTKLKVGDKVVAGVTPLI